MPAKATCITATGRMPYCDSLSGEQLATLIQRLKIRLTEDLKGLLVHGLEG